MTVLRMLTTFSATALLALPASGGFVTFDMMSNGRYWWGGPWIHKPEHGNTYDCICMKGKKMNGELDAICFKGTKTLCGDLPCEIEMKIPFDGNFPIDITIHGNDALWVDRFRVKTNAGTRWFGSDDTHGYCLSKDRNDSFDKWSTHDGCFETLSFDKNGKFDGYPPENNGRGYWRDYNLVFESITKCADLRLQSRRKAEVPSMAESSVSSEEGLENLDVLEYADPDPTGESPNQVHNEIDALVVSKLHEAIRNLVRENNDVTDGQIDKLLNSAMLEVEHIVEKKGNKEEVSVVELEEEDELEPEDLAGSAGMGSTNSNVQGSNVLGRLQNLEENP